jgi:NAD(P)H-dependent FMN reductase
MKKVTAFIGTASRKATFYAVQEFEKNLKRYEDVDFEYVFLNDYRLEFCCGCKVCFDKGEQYCPLKDDRDILIEKIEQSDGIIFATPSYTYQVSARMKNLFDRMAFIFHRPRFFGKAFTAILTQGVPVGDNIRRYIEETGGHLGFTVTRGCSLWTLDPMTESQRESLERKVSKTAARFYRGLIRSTPPVPSFFRLMLFRTGRWVSAMPPSGTMTITISGQGGLRRILLRIRSLGRLSRAPAHCLTNGAAHRIADITWY